MSRHTKAGRRAAFRRHHAEVAGAAMGEWQGRRLRAFLDATPAALEAQGWEVMAWTDTAEMEDGVVRLEPDEWARFCELAGLDPATGGPLPAPVPGGER